MQLRETIEYSILQIFEVYFSIAQFTESIELNKIRSFKERQKRAQSAFIHVKETTSSFKCTSRVINDSISLIQVNQRLDNSKRDLNLLMNQPIDRIIV